MLKPWPSPPIGATGFLRVVPHRVAMLPGLVTDPHIWIS